jgi:hypothetical protein
MSIFDKLNLKNQTDIIVLNAAESFEKELAKLKTSVHREASHVSNLDFVIAFVTRQDELDALTQTLTSKAKGDATLWFAYPKQSSKRYTCEFNRHTGWQILGKAGFEAVRQVTIDED